MADSINLLPNQRIVKKYSEILKSIEDEEKDGNDIAVDVITRMGLLPKKEEV